MLITINYAIVCIAIAMYCYVFNYDFNKCILKIIRSCKQILPPNKCFLFSVHGYL